MARATSVNPNSPVATAASPGQTAAPVDPITGQPIYNPVGTPGATAITAPPGADPTQYYKPVDRTDPRFRAADPHWTPQQRAAYETAVNSGPAGHDAAAQLGAASWADWDQRRAGYAVQEADARARWKASLSAGTGGTGVDAPVYDPDTDTFSYVDKDGKWTHGVSAADIYSKLTDDVKKQYPEWYFGEYATQQEQNKRTNLDAAAYQNQSFARMGQQSTRYAATGL